MVIVAGGQDKGWVGTEFYGIEAVDDYRWS